MNTQPKATTQQSPKPRSKHGSEKRQRATFLHLRATPAEKVEINTRAQRAGLTVSGFLRALIFGKDTPQPRAAMRPPVEAEALTALRYELRKIGGNLNQIAHHLNQGQDPDKQTLADLTAQHQTVLEAILTALGKKPAEAAATPPQKKPKTPPASQSPLAEKLFGKGQRQDPSNKTTP